MKEDGGPAFPRPCGTNSFADSPASLGMSLRDWFAGMCLALYMPNHVWDKSLTQYIAESCYRQADAMLKEREK